VSPRQQAAWWLGGVAAALALLWALQGVLLPFVAAVALAYLLDPVAGRMERLGLSRPLATAVITAGFFAVIALVVLAGAPVAYRQAVGFAARVPDYVEKLREPALLLFERLLAGTGVARNIDLGAAATASGGRIAEILGGALAGLVGSGLAVFNAFSLAIITPVVAFFLLRDWDGIVRRVDGWLPPRRAETIRGLAREIDGVLAGFVRGQMMVAAAMGIYYGLGLTVLGVEFGLLIGLTAGLLGFVPYVGAGIGAAAGLTVAIIQFWPNYAMPLAVLAVFAVGQAIDGLVLTPKLVGDRVGLHPVWIIFALMAGAALFGFVGLLLAVPVFAAGGVLARFGLTRYLESRLFKS
jgi:predicted PurR-regulated permease PerM